MSVPSNTREAESASIRSSMTEEDLEEARQRLLDHMEVEHEDRGGGKMASSYYILEVSLVVAITVVIVHC